MQPASTPRPAPLPATGSTTDVLLLLGGILLGGGTLLYFIHRR